MQRQDYNSARITLDSLRFKLWLLSHLMKDVKQKSIFKACHALFHYLVTVRKEATAGRSEWESADLCTGERTCWMSSQKV